jgi:hypothetical protein
MIYDSIEILWQRSEPEGWRLRTASAGRESYQRLEVLDRLSHGASCATLKMAAIPHLAGPDATSDWEALRRMIDIRR